MPSSTGVVVEPGAVDIGVELVPLDRYDTTQGVPDDDEYEPASGRRVRQSIAAMGSAVVESVGRLVGEQVGVVVRETIAQLDETGLRRDSENAFAPTMVQITFGLKMTAGAGKAIEAVVSAGGEASVLVVVTLSHNDLPASP